jgi:hypothetical protein
MPTYTRWIFPKLFIARLISKVLSLKKAEIRLQIPAVPSVIAAPIVGSVSVGAIVHSIRRSKLGKPDRVIRVFLIYVTLASGKRFT